MEFVIWCDESIKQGKYFSNFYGGVIVPSAHVDKVKFSIADCKEKLHLGGEVKWTKTSENYLSKYCELTDCFFGHLRDGFIKTRIMFTQNTHVATGLTREQKENGFFLLYYQFIKHAFGLTCNDRFPEPVNIRLYFDKLPDKEEKCKSFKEYIFKLNSRFNPYNVFIKSDNIAEVVSHDHEILQCLDIVLGAMAFKLNDMHKEKIPGSSKRGKKTIAKEKLYKHIYQHITYLHPNFNIGVSTGWRDKGKRAWWSMPYGHWKFVPREKTYDSSKSK